MAFPESFISELKARNALEDIVSQYASLKRAGSNMVCNCPFHSERTPSFTVFSSSDSFYCFGCGAGGDVITFIMRIENLDYLAAIEFLANRAGLTVPETGNSYEKKVDKKRYYEMNAQAARFFYETLISPLGTGAMAYLKKRGLNSQSIIKRFGIGFAPDSYDSLTSLLTRNGFTAEEIKTAFLGGIAKNGKLFDYFRNRIMFPVIDVSGNVIAFSGRILEPAGENDRKYFNTTDTPVFKKSRSLFALNIAKNHDGKSLILCEGNMDVVSLHAAGFSNSVASLGTALSPEQARILRRYADTVYICYDSDTAGKAAAKKAIRLLTDADLQVKVISLTGAKDPDEYIKKYGKEAFGQLVKNAPGYIEYLFNEILGKYNLNSMDEKKLFISECIDMLSKVYSPVEREIYIGKINELTGVDTAVLKSEALNKLKRHAKTAEKTYIDAGIKKTLGYGDKINPDKARFASVATKEENILGLLLLRPEYLLAPDIRKELDPALFSSEFCRKALSTLIEMTENGEPFEMSALNEHFTPEETGSLIGMRQRRSEYENNSPQVIYELFKRLKEELEKKKTKEEPLSNEWITKLKTLKS